jgi:hypothetical protein
MPDERNRVIQVHGLISGQPTAFDGGFVVEFDASRDGVEPHSMRPMMAHLITTPNVDEATRCTAEEAFLLWQSVDSRNPVRGDGKPNRPFTAFTISVTDPEDVL